MGSFCAENWSPLALMLSADFGYRKKCLASIRVRHARCDRTGPLLDAAWSNRLNITATAARLSGGLTFLPEGTVCDYVGRYETQCFVWLM